MQARHRRNIDGFSLVELSIVLVILGLLVGGILAGRSLIHASEVRKVTNDISRYRTAAFAFRDKYFDIPGDLTNAQSFWPSTYNGPGNQHLSWNWYGINFWNHLQLAGMIEGNIDAVSSAVTQITVGTHAPACPLGACGYSMVYFGAWTNQPPLVGRNILYMGLETANNYTSSNIKSFATEDLWNIDTKMDDGQPDLGLIIAGGCVSGSTYPLRTYNFTSTSGCRMLVDFFK